ncbi:hypothetical protein ANME2D_02813 [Candidatus Methanoperedens nitroreducens]|uniref:DUF362 domain-containing protein n=1 Tax=Candidatus Methanoperedens nitratireducens TaxID=1392998 RepID=A0A062V2C9_9EURY|nr:DUF362 domain-containing protein [Candidatus Methanoperedens nitroreducens]KCZ70788.1 hypothetical protein ANME2D_02813 [Candidatus Methanoperedens nitroreducens]MDJ1420643.1 DUF362 domain-containing protein [Candidatus Methanoperedens sp.]
MTVKIVKAKKYDVKSLESLIRDAIKDIGSDLKNKKTVLLKPNIVIAAKPGSAIITHPAVVEALINVLEENGFEDIIIGEGPGVGADEAKAFEVSGYSKLAAKKNVKLINLNKAERTELKWKYGIIKIPKIVLEADLYINLPKMKTHGQTAVTLAMKNQKGLLSRADKQKFHKLGLHEPLVELARVIKPHLTIVDAIEGMEGEGPLNGKKKKVGALVIGTDQVETDAICCDIMGIDPEKVGHIIEGIKQNIGPEVPDLIGDDIKEVRAKFKQANEKYGKFLNVYSWRNPYACSMCIDSFSLAVRSSIWSPKYWLTFLPRFTYYAVLKHLYIIQGKHAKIPDMKGKVICLGDCTREIAEKNNLRHIKGCPPNSREILDNLR